MLKVLLFVLLVVFGIFYATSVREVGFKWEKIFKKSYYINRYYNYVMKAEDRRQIKKAVVGRLQTLEGYENTEEKDIGIFIDNHINKIETQYATGTLILRTDENTKPLRWVAVKSEFEWIAPHVGDNQPDCFNIKEYNFPPEITTCIDY